MTDKPDVTPENRLASCLGALAQPGTAVSATTASQALKSAEDLIETGATEKAEAVCRAYLCRTRHPDFLLALPDDEARHAWAETTYSISETLGYTLADMLEDRVRENPRRTCFDVPGGGLWTYENTLRRVRSFAAVWHGRGIRRMALWADNSLDTACSDIACLAYDIFITPLNVSFDDETMAWILRRCDIDAVVTDNVARARRIQAIAGHHDLDIKIYMIGDTSELPRETHDLAATAARMGNNEIDTVLRDRPRLAMRDISTVMFTSGSTGQPKGVSFSTFNLVTKRFARAAALPKVGDGEVLFCYLPLFHTFGRYLEMLGTVFWGGTYVFAGNPSSDTLLAHFSRVRPTALISIPLRWIQLHERVLARAGEDATETGLREAFAEVTGGRLRWGLSAAGYLSPRIFRFFNRHGVDLCSGFGMTEATGGITMTAPGQYRDNSVGLPLPGIRWRLADHDELHITGPYVAGYIDPDGPPGDFAPQSGEEDWLPTGDIFRYHEDGHLEIIDRIKDIYKNNRGQTIAPRKVEQKFANVPGIKRVFLVGDGRACNTLLIVPDSGDPVVASSPSPEHIEEYFHRIVTDANQDLASFERVVNFALLERDFSLEKEELTAKGSYKRKNIEANFSETIASLYQATRIELQRDGLTISIPRWFFRDLGILESDLDVGDEGLIDRHRDLVLRLGPVDADGLIRIGDLRYRLKGDRLDLGTFVRQPLLWAGNPAMERFFPCKTGWDTPLRKIDEQVLLPVEGDVELPEKLPSTGQGAILETICRLTAVALFGPENEALPATETLGKLLSESHDEPSDLIRRRLEGLAGRDEKSIRCLAYSILVLDNPTPDFQRFLPSFIASGRSFLCDESIEKIAQTNIEPRGLQSLRQRLQVYRQQLQWPADEQVRSVFVDLFHLLSDFARYNTQFYGPVREELVSWILHTRDPQLGEEARRYFLELADWFEANLRKQTVADSEEIWQQRIVMQSGFGENEQKRIREILADPVFLKESILLACGTETIEPKDILPGGVWVSRILSLHKYSRYRVSVNASGGRHFDLQLIIREDQDQDWVLDTVFWHVAIRGYPSRAPILPRFGCCRPELGAISLAYMSDLNVWEKIREFASTRDPGTPAPAPAQWRQLFITAMATVLSAWHNSGRSIVPGNINPTNVVVPEPDFREGNHVVSLIGWKPADKLSTLLGALERNFFLQTENHYPWCRRTLQREWICNACVEAFGVEDALTLLAEARGDVSADLAGVIDEQCEILRHRYYASLPLACAIDRYKKWQHVNPQATWTARLEILRELYRLYRLDRLPEIARYHLYRHTCFAEVALPALDAFDRLLVRLFQRPDLRAVQLVELSDLQNELDGPQQRRAFRRLAFPRARPKQEAEVRTVGEQERQRVILKTHVEDRNKRSYMVHEPTEPAEIGQLYRLYLLAGYPKTIGEDDCFLVAMNADEQIVGGVSYRHIDNEIVHLDGIVVTSALQGCGLTSALLEDFCTRMADLGILAVKTHFFLRKFYQRRGFEIDRRWSGLVRFLSN